MNQDIIIDIPFNKHGQVKHEDAPPVMLPNLIAVADGLGGEGAILHTLPQFNSYEHFLNVFFSNHPHKNLIINDPDMLAYIRASFDSVITQKKLTNTGAYFGSRFLMLHLICYSKFYLDLHLKNPLKITALPLVLKKDLETYLKKYLAESINSLNPMQDHIIANKSYFPTTVSGCFILNLGDQIEVISFFAGDSKGFLINQDGFFAISKDHEKDNNAGMSNLIFVNYTKQWVTGNFFIETLLIKTRQPFCILQVSDGFFDPLMNPDSLRMKVQLPLNFLNILQSSTSYDSYRTNLTKYYGNPSGEFTGDDRTLALRFYGFRNFEEFKNLILVKNKLLIKYQELSHILDKYIELIVLDNSHDQRIRNLIMDHNLMDRLKIVLSHDVIQNDPFNFKKFDGFDGLSQLVITNESSKIKLYESFSILFNEDFHSIIELLINFNEMEKFPLKNLSSLAKVYYQSHQKLLALNEELKSLKDNLLQLENSLKEDVIEKQKMMIAMLTTLNVSKFNEEEIIRVRKVFSDMTQLQDDTLLTLDVFATGQMKKNSNTSKHLDYEKLMEYLLLKDKLSTNQKLLATTEEKVTTSKDSLLNDAIIKPIFDELINNSRSFPYLIKHLKNKNIDLQSNSLTKLNQAISTFINFQIIPIVKDAIKENDANLLNAFGINGKEIKMLTSAMKMMSANETETLAVFSHTFDQFIS